jgi:hypothetical protein
VERPDAHTETKQQPLNNLEGRSDKILASTEAALRSTHDDQEAEALFPGPLHKGHIRSPASTCPTEQRSYGWIAQ